MDNEGAKLDRAFYDVLDRYVVSPLPPGFADKVMASALARAPALPRQRRPEAAQTLRNGRRIVLGLAATGLLASAAAATGALEVIGIDLPPARQVIAAITGAEANAEVRTGQEPRTPGPADKPTSARAGPGPSPDEIDVAVERIEARRETRIAVRRQIVDQRLEQALVRRRAAGLPVPDRVREQQIRGRLAEARKRRDAAAAQNREARQAFIRAALEQRRGNSAPVAAPAAELPAAGTSQQAPFSPANANVAAPIPNVEHAASQKLHPAAAKKAGRWLIGDAPAPVQSEAITDREL